jgi:hypothetical protein
MALRYIPQRAAVRAAQLSIESSSQGSAWFRILRVALLQLSLRAARRSHTAAAEGRLDDRAERGGGGGCKLVPLTVIYYGAGGCGWRGEGVGDGVQMMKEGMKADADMFGGRPSCQLSTRLFQSVFFVFCGEFRN